MPRHDRRRSTVRSVARAAAVVLFALVLPSTASAALGGDVTSVGTDVARMHGAVTRIGQTSAYAVHEIRGATGTMVREFVSPAGKVFAVAWDGPWMPDLRQLLGAYFDQYMQAANAAKAGRSGHRPLVIREAGLVVEVGGHPRAFAGRAYLQEMIPQGVQADSIR